MKRAVLLLIAVAAIVCGAALPFAQDKPNFSGKWVRQDGPGVLQTGALALTITQAFDQVTIGPISDQNPDGLAIKLDGSETKTIVRGRGAPVEVVSRATWENAKLVISNAISTSRGTLTTRDVYALDHDVMTIESSGTGQDGTPFVSRLSYKKSTADVARPASPSVQAVPPTLEPGWTSLFNGKDFTGWKFSGPAESFTIQDGAIVAHGAVSHAYYDGPFRNHSFRNFEVKVDVMTRANSNGGVYVLTEFQEAGGNVRASGRFPSKGFEIQVNNSYTADRVKTGSLYHVTDILDNAPAKDDEWFTEHIIVQGDTITIKVNDKQLVQWTQPADWNGGPEGPGRKITGPGTIALQGHDPNSTVYYRNIRIKPLD